ncbi:MAG: DUF523 domain-containing protein [Proteobacteria bacterium]|nr:DUF523 domain-containing protein [Pseudomonadota bacterium]MBU1738469.1 DUF523 domain-containing protein [Pseudomonadota bacterium]
MYLVSSCLMGLKTRYDGAAKPSPQCMEFLEGAVWVPVCPEQLGGLATPRLPAEIVDGDGDDVLAGNAGVVNSGGVEVTGKFVEGARQVLFIAEKLGVDGILLKSGSPSCGCGEILGVTAALLRNNGFPVREF